MIQFPFLAGVFGLQYYKTQELYFEVEMSKWNSGTVGNNTGIPESICSKECPMGRIKNLEVQFLSRLTKKIPSFLRMLAVGHVSYVVKILLLPRKTRARSVLKVSFPSAFTDLLPIILFLINFRF